MKFNSTQYKQRNISIWNEVAPRYHKRWARDNQGPFQSTSKLVQLLKIKKEDHVLDLACGTGVVTNQIKSKISNLGSVVGGDTSITAIKTAKKWIVNIKGGKLKGRYCLLHFKPKEKNWLFFKLIK